MLTRSAEPDEDHSDEDKDEVQGFCAKISFTEEDGSTKEGYDHRAASHKGDDQNHGVGIAQGCIVSKVRQTDEYRDQRDCPAPSERSRAMALRIPEQSTDNEHDQHLIEIEPALNKHRTELPHHEFIVQAADCTHNGSTCYAPDPLIAFEINIFFLSSTAHHKDR